MKPFVAVLTATGLNDKNRCKSTTFLKTKSTSTEKKWILDKLSKNITLTGHIISIFEGLIRFFFSKLLTKAVFLPKFAT